MSPEVEEGKNKSKVIIGLLIVEQILLDLPY